MLRGLTGSVGLKGLVMGATVAGVALSAAPARALDDGKGDSILDVFNFVGLGSTKEAPTIAYRERAPLVLPPKAELEKPVPPAAERAANWPQNQEAVRAAKKAQAGRMRAVSFDGTNANYAGQLAREGRIDPADTPVKKPECSMVPDAVDRCDPTTMWKNLSAKQDMPDHRQMQAGVEPEREYLTQPPKGYMAPKKVERATFDEPNIASEGTDVFDYYHKKPGQ